MNSRLATLALLIALLGGARSVWLAWPGYAGMNHASGTVAALAEAATRGEAPGHVRSGEFLATLYAPPFPLAVAALRRPGGRWHDALRWASLLAALALLAATAAAARASGANAAGTAAAVALLACAFPFVSAALSGRADALAAALAVAAFAAWQHDPEQRRGVTGALAALALLVKLTAVALPLALLAHAVASRRLGPALRFAFAAAVTLAIGLSLTLPAHGPGWYANAAQTLLFAPPNTSHPLRGPAELLRYLGSFAEVAALAALALCAVTTRESGGRRARYALGASLLVALVVLANRGSDHNHLVECLALAAACAGAWLSRASGPAAGLATAIVLLAVAAASWRDVQGFGREAAQPATARAAVLAAVRAEPGRVFSEDALVALDADKRPAIADPASLRALAARGDADARNVVRALAERRYDLIVLETDLDEGAREWYRDFHLGGAAVGAIRAGYEQRGSIDGYALYRLRAAPPPP